MIFTAVNICFFPVSGSSLVLLLNCAGSQLSTPVAHPVLGVPAVLPPSLGNRPL